MDWVTCDLHWDCDDVLLEKKKMKKLIKKIVAGLFFVTAVQSHAALMQIPSSLEELPIQESGRRKPYLIFAEETLRTLSGQMSLIVAGKKTSAVDLITALWLEPEQPWAMETFILVSYGPLKTTLGLPLKQKLFSYDALRHNSGLLTLIDQAGKARRADPSHRLEGLLKEAADVGMRMALFEEIQDGSLFRIVPNAQPGARWSTLGEWEQTAPSQEREKAQQAFARLQQAWLQNSSSLFLQSLTELQQLFQNIDPQPVPHWKLQLEVFYQKFHPFRWAWIFYALAGILFFFSPDLGKKEHKKKSLLERLSWLFIGSGFFFQAAGLAARILIAGRPPVTNMYEVVIWVAFGTVFFALLFESFLHGGFFILGAIPFAVVSLILADSQPMILNPSINPLVPVLRDNFWLTIHVLTITLSYAAFALALGIAHLILIRLLLKHQSLPILYNYLYRTLQVGVLLLAVGTILGGVWANYSWGRFWDWDPKETWALITLLIYLFLLHGRIAGRWGGFGLTIGSILAFLSVLMACYGVNFVLGTGLHSYGFSTGGFSYVLGFVGLEVTLVATAIFKHKKHKKKIKEKEN
ncbi:MAG: ABC transporter permease [Verrucomicrobia bacterium]|nr:ABC transporter permease [Verrucomicrobiota bacterium]